MAVTGEALRPAVRRRAASSTHGSRGPSPLTPDESRSCVDYFAVELALGQRTVGSTAVNLVWSEP